MQIDFYRIRRIDILAYLTVSTVFWAISWGPLREIKSHHASRLCNRKMKYERCTIICVGTIYRYAGNFIHPTSPAIVHLIGHTRNWLQSPKALSCSPHRIWKYVFTLLFYVLMLYQRYWGQISFHGPLDDVYDEWQGFDVLMSGVWRLSCPRR